VKELHALWDSVMGMMASYTPDTQQVSEWSAKLQGMFPPASLQIGDVDLPETWSTEMLTYAAQV